MGDFILDWNEGNLSLDGSVNGIPIPRNQNSQSYTRFDLTPYNNYQMYYEQDSQSPRPPLVPPNSLVTGFGPGSGNYSSQFTFSNDQQRLTFSPLNVGSPLTPNTNMDMDVEIKTEPLEDLLDISGMITTSESSRPTEDNLLDNVNFEDLIMTGDLDSSTTCLDPQHSSPAAMAAVHPDEVFGMTRSESRSCNVNQSLTPSISVPVKSESYSFGGKTENYSFGIGGPSSYPYQSTDWRGAFLNLAAAANEVSNLYQTQAHNFKESPVYSSRISDSGFSQNILEQTDQQSFNNDNNNNEPVYTQAESHASSALHDLLVSSPSTSHSNQQSPPSNLAALRSSAAQEVSVGQSVPGPPSFLTSCSALLASRLSSSAPVNDFSIEKIWQRREPRQHLLSTGSLIGLEEGGSTSSLSTGGGILSPAPHDLSIDEGIDSDDDSEAERYDSDSDNDSIMSEEISASNHSMKKERHFWQYNVQAKGPKGQRVNIIKDEDNPYELSKIMDPVFSPMCSVQGIKHSGKARRGDGNDLTPSPRKLVSIGNELDKLNKKINEMTPVSDLPSTVRSKSRKEKNKLASRACRLKKKAQHEANKIKLYGLEQEHRGLLNLIKHVREELTKKVSIGYSDFGAGDSSQIHSSFGSPQSETMPQVQQQLTNQIEKAIKFRGKQRIAGQTTEFVNKVIDNCRNGNPNGGLDVLAQNFGKASLSVVDADADSELYT